MGNFSRHATAIGNLADLRSSASIRGRPKLAVHAFSLYNGALKFLQKSIVGVRSVLAESKKVSPVLGPRTSPYTSPILGPRTSPYASPILGPSNGIAAVRNNASLLLRQLQKQFGQYLKEAENARLRYIKSREKALQELHIQKAAEIATAFVASGGTTAITPNVESISEKIREEKNIPCVEMLMYEGAVELASRAEANEALHSREPLESDKLIKANKGDANGSDGDNEYAYSTEDDENYQEALQYSFNLYMHAYSLIEAVALENKMTLDTTSAEKNLVILEEYKSFIEIRIKRLRGLLKV